MSNKPAFCPYIYTDGHKLYLEFDRMVLDFVFSDAGLHRALKHIPNIAAQPGFVSGNSNFTNGKSLKGHIARKTKPMAPKVSVSRRTLQNRETKALRERFGHGADDIVRKLMSGKLK